jgi:Ferritin-like domain
MERPSSHTKKEDGVMSNLTLEQLDQDGAIQEGIADLYGHSRADFLRKAVVGGGVLIAALSVPPRGEAAAASDVRIFQFGLNFEYLQSTFYTEAERLGTIAEMAARKALWARTLGAHERAHVAIIKEVLGRAAGKRPFFNFRGNTETEDRFTRTAVAMEDLTTALLTGLTPKLQDRGLAAAAFSLMTVEARHAAWARHLAGVLPVASAFDEPKSLDEVDGIVASTRFISTLAPRTTTTRNPQFTG